MSPPRPHRFRSLLLLVMLFGLGVMIRTPAVFAQAAECCVVPDAGGTAVMPPTAGCLYLGSTEITDGLPFGTTIQINAAYGNFVAVSEAAGGSLGGTISNFQAVFTMNMTGTGVLLGFNRFIAIPLTGTQQISWSPRVPFMPVQNFAADLQLLQGQVIGDPDFDLLRITGGTLFGMPTPGQAQVVSSFGNWAVNGYFDLSHRIDFVGNPGGALAGMSGSTTRQRRFTMCPENVVPARDATWSGIKALLRD